MKIKYLLITYLLTPLLFLTNIYAECNFGLIYPLTGDFASGGQECLDGHQVAVQRHKQKKLPITFKIEDSRALGKEGITQFKKLVELDKVSAVGVVRAAVGMPINPLSKQFMVPIIGPVSHPNFTTQNPNAYQIWPSTKEETLVLAKLMITDGVKSFYSLSSEDEWYLSFQKALTQNYQELGGKLIGSEEVDANFLDFRSLISKIKQSKAETVFLGLSPSQLVIFIKQFREAGLTQKLYSTFWIKSENVVKNLTPELLDQIAFVEIDTLKPKYIAASKNLNKDRETSAMSYTCYLTTEALIQACEKQIFAKQGFPEIFSEMKSIEALDETVELSKQIAKLTVIPREYVNGNLKSIPFNDTK